VLPSRALAASRLDEDFMSFTVGRYLRLTPLAIAIASLVVPVRAADFSGSVDIGGGRKMYLECSGAGSPTVVLISGKGNGAADWSEILDPTDPGHDAKYDVLVWGKGDLHKSDSAVFPMVARFTRVCAYDRPGVRLDGPDRSTPVPQPHPVDQAADDLHRMLTAAGASKQRKVAVPQQLSVRDRLCRNDLVRFRNHLVRCYIPVA
jgi:hypothetical protein